MYVCPRKRPANTKFIIDKVKFPIIVGFLLPYRDKIQTDTQVAMSWQMFAISGVYKDRVALYFVNSTPT